MKFNFKKIASVVTSALMLGSTVGFAAAAWPAPFVNGGVENATVVYGASSTDYAAATNIGAELSKSVSGTAASTTVGLGSESKLIDGATKLTVGTNLTQVKATPFSKTDLPILLADVPYQSADGQTSTIEQQISLGTNLTYAFFKDSREPINNVPTLGVNVNKLQVMNYTASFKDASYIESDVSSTGRLEDIQNTDITLLGKSYKLLNAYNSTTKLELMGGAVSAVISQDEEQTYTIDGKTYTVKLDFVDSTGAKFTVNGETTNKMAAGVTQKLKDGTQLGVRELLYQGFATGVMKAEFSLGAEKLTLEHGNAIKINDVEESAVKAYITRDYVSSKVRISQIALQWMPTAYPNNYITDNTVYKMPGLGSLSFVSQGPTTVAKEIIKVANDDKTINLIVPVKSGDATIPVLSGNSSVTTYFTKIGDSNIGNGFLKTTTANNFLYDVDTDDAGFVATYMSGSTGESYYLTADISTSGGINYTTIKDEVAGTTAGTCDKIKSTSSCTIGGVITLTFTNADSDNNNVTITGSTNVYFDRVISKEGALVYLPVNDATMIPSNSSSPQGPGINLSAMSASNTSAWKLIVSEEDSNSMIGAGKNITAAVGWTSDKAEVKSVTQTGLSGGAYLSIPGTSTTYVGYVASDLGTKITYDTAPTQDTLELEYHGEQMVGNIYLSSVASSATATTYTGSVKVVKDSELDAAGKAKNLVVVGGSCINTVAANLLGGALCGADFTAKTEVAAGSYLVKVYANPYAAADSGKIAMLIAGYDAADTTNAVVAVKEKADFQLTTVDASKIGPVTA